MTLGVKKSKNHKNISYKMCDLNMGFILYIFLTDANKKNAVNNNGVLSQLKGVN